MDASQIALERAQVMDNARAWLGTPYHHQGTLRGVGCDCVTYLIGAFVDARIGLERPEIKHYPPDWHVHRDVERYMEGILAYCAEVAQPGARHPQPADIILFRVGRTYSHGALVEEWPVLLHSVIGVGVQRINYGMDPNLRVIRENVPERGAKRPVKIFTLNQWLV